MNLNDNFYIFTSKYIYIFLYKYSLKIKTNIEFDKNFDEPNIFNEIY